MAGIREACFGLTIFRSSRSRYIVAMTFESRCKLISNTMSTAHFFQLLIKI